MTYSHAGNNKEDDDRYLRIKFKKYAEQAWDEKGNQIKGQISLSKKGAQKFAAEVLQNWKGLTKEENESYIAQNFENIWSNNVSSAKKDMGMLNLEQACKFMGELN